MMNKIPCEIVRDLLPSYIEELTSETTNLYVADHISGCPECKKVLDSMRSEETDLQPSPAEEKKEIDFLKKNRRRNRWILTGCILVMVVVLGVLFVTRYMIGEKENDLYGDFFMWDIQVDGNRLSMDGTSVNDIFKVTGFDCTENEGILKVSTRQVPSGIVAGIIYGKSFHFDYVSSEPVRQVNVNGRILYSENELISAKASAIYATRHLYIGDMPANARTANAVNVSNFLGPFENELRTAEAPYEWKLKLLADIPGNRQELRESDMRSFAYLMMAVIDNLDVVTFDYTVNGKKTAKSFTSSQAAEFLGQDIKNCYDDVGLLDELVKKAGIDRYVFGSVYADHSTQHHFPVYFSVVPDTPEAVKSIQMHVYADGEPVSGHTAENADGSAYNKGQLIEFFLDQEDFRFRFQDDEVITLKFDVETEDGTFSEVLEQLRLPENSVRIYDLHLTGSLEQGFHIGQ